MFKIKSGELFAENVSLNAVADAVGTPFYAYSTAVLEANYLKLRDAFAGFSHKICYAMKANSNQAVIKTFANMGAGVDVVSLGELKRALLAGVSPDKIMFSGVGKTVLEHEAALKAGIFCINVESVPEVYQLSRVASKLGVKAPVSFRINPDVDAKTHAKISTGKSENKFGIPLKSALAVYKEAASLPGIQICGVDMHIGSQILDLEPFDHAFKLLAKFVRELRNDGHTIHHVDAGGGLGISYIEGQEEADVHAYAKIIEKHLVPLGVDIIFEPGRFLVGNAGTLITEVLYVKEGDGKNFVIVDAAMNDLIRPTLYEAHHGIQPVTLTNRANQKVDIVGPVCETGDYIGLGRDMPEMKAGERLAIMSAGAYGAVQAGTYNTRALIPEVLVKGDDYAIIRKRLSLDDLIALDDLPGWMS
jgi:diaminopimelate decarboxylase